PLSPKPECAPKTHVLKATGRANPRPHPPGTRSRVRHSKPGSSAGRRPSFRSSLLHILPHRSNVTGRLLLGPDFEPLGGLFQIPEQIRVNKPLAKLRNHWLERLPYAEELATGFEEKVIMQQPIVE